MTAVQYSRPVEYRVPCSRRKRSSTARLLLILWVLSPIDLLPGILPVIGPLDDVVAVILLLRYAARAIHRDLLFAAWPAEPRLLERLLDAQRR